MRNFLCSKVKKSSDRVMEKEPKARVKLSLSQDGEFAKEAVKAALASLGTDDLSKSRLCIVFEKRGNADFGIMYTTSVSLPSCLPAFASVVSCTRMIEQRRILFFESTYETVEIGRSELLNKKSNIFNEKVSRIV